MTKFFIGQKVVCIGEFNVKRKYKEQFPVKGKTYTVRGFIEYNGEVGILLEEIVNPSHQYKDGFNEAAFLIYNFRPAEYQSAMTEILDRFPMTEERPDVKIKKESLKELQKTASIKTTTNKQK